MSVKRLFLYILILSVSISALTGIGVLLFGEFGSLEIRILFTTLTITAMSILGLACGTGYDSGSGRILPIIGIVCSVLGGAMTLLIIWDIFDDSELFIKATASVTLVAVSCAHLSLISLARLDNKFKWSQIAAFVCVILLTSIFLIIIWLEPEIHEGFVSRLIGILSILIATMTVMTPIFHKLSNNQRTLEQINNEIEELEARVARLNIEKNNLQNSKNNS